MEKTINNMPQSGIEIYTAPDNSIQLQVKLDQDTVWLTQKQMSLLFGRDRTVISRHIRNIYTERELSEDITCAKFAHMGIEGDQSYETTLYNLDVIISVGYLRHHWWNEAGQMAAVADNEHCGFYGYDGNGERAYKLTGSTELDTTLTDGCQMRMHLDNTVLYVNPYFIVTPTGYTKQYYNGMQHIATRIGELNYLPENIIDTSALGMERLMNARSYMDTLFVRSVSLRPDTTATFVDIDGEAFPELQWQGVDSSLVWTLAIESDSDMLYPVLTKDISCLDPRVSGVYYYHSDHLGSAAWVTHGAQAVQFVHYMPFGEMWYNQQGSAYNERYKFTGKERDAETGYDYFGARYYASGNLSWLSVDPLASPYAYAAWNPVKFVDPDGMENVVALPSPAEETKQVIQSYESNGDVIHFFAHGEQNRIQISGKGDREKGGYITRPEQLNLFLLSNSEIWQEKETPENGGYAIIVFHSCATGQGENPIAQQISSSPEFENVLIVAPSNNIRIMSDITENVPAWNMYLNGKLVNSFDGKSRPVFSNPQKQVEKYLNKK